MAVLGLSFNLVMPDLPLFIFKLSGLWLLMVLSKT